MKRDWRVLERVGNMPRLVQRKSKLLCGNESACFACFKFFATDHLGTFSWLGSV